MAKRSTEYAFTRETVSDDDTDDEEIEVYVEFTLYPYHPATYEQPAEGGEIEIDGIYTLTGTKTPFAMTAVEEDQLEQWLHEQDWNDYDDD